MVARFEAYGMANVVKNHWLSNGIGNVFGPQSPVCVYT